MSLCVCVHTPCTCVHGCNRFIEHSARAREGRHTAAFPRKLMVQRGPWTVVIQRKVKMLGSRRTQFGGSGGQGGASGISDQLTPDTKDRYVFVCVCKTERD